MSIDHLKSQISNLLTQQIETLGQTPWVLKLDRSRRNITAKKKSKLQKDRIGHGELGMGNWAWGIGRSSQVTND